MGDFDDLLEANREYAETFSLGGFDGVAHAGVAIVTCMDSRIDPLRLLVAKEGRGAGMLHDLAGGRPVGSDHRALRGHRVGGRGLGKTAHPARRRPGAPR